MGVGLVASDNVPCDGQTVVFSHMKFQPDRPETGNFIARWDPQGIWVGPQCWSGPVVVPWAGDITSWALERWDDLDVRHFEPLLALRPELVIVGSGARHRFVLPRHAQHLIGAGIGVESMDSTAACRTFNVLVSEGRRVVAALMPPGAV